MKVENGKTEIVVENTRFQVISHFKDSGSDTIDSVLRRLMEREQENLLTDI